MALIGVVVSEEKMVNDDDDAGRRSMDVPKNLSCGENSITF